MGYFHHHHYKEEYMSIYTKDKKLIHPIPNELHILQHPIDAYPIVDISQSKENRWLRVWDFDPTEFRDLF